MKLELPRLVILSLPLLSSAHYTFPSMIYAGTVTAPWQFVRQWAGYYTNGPVVSVTSLDIRCNVNGSVVSAPGKLSVAAGANVGFQAEPSIYHPGPVLAYLAKVPAGRTALNFNGDGAVWFKIYQQGPVIGPDRLTWPSDGARSVNFTIPAATPPGDYLIRLEHIGLHSASSQGGAQFYISCGQIAITGSGRGTPGPLVAFPGAYKATDPGIQINIYYPVPKNYTPPGPAVWTGR